MPCLVPSTLSRPPWVIGACRTATVFEVVLESWLQGTGQVRNIVCLPPVILHIVEPETLNPKP